MKLEIRSVKKALTVRAAPADSGYIGVLVGHAAVFNSPSVEFAGWEKPWVERIAPGAFTRTLKESPEVFALYQHNSADPLARAPGTLVLSEDERGLAFEASLIDTQRNRDVHRMVSTGLLDSMSFGFNVRSVKWEEGKEQDTRTLLDVELGEISVVTWPAYPAASVGTRGCNVTPAELAELKAERDTYFDKARAVTAPAATNHLLRYWERRVRLF